MRTRARCISLGGRGSAVPRVVTRMTPPATRKLAVLVAAALIGTSTSALAATPDMAQVDAAFASMPKDGPGCALGVYSGGKTVALKGYGFADIENRVPITPDTVFNIGSVSKQFTAMSAIILADLGKLSLDDDIRKYLPEMRDYGTPITIRQLINHTSGVRNYFDVLFIKGLSHKDPATPDEVYALLTGLSKLDFTPGTQQRYSNSGYFLLGRIIERVSGQSLAQFEQQNIFGPLGMAHTRVRDDFAALTANRASGYISDSKGGFRMAGSQIEVTGDAGVLTTVRDLALWDEDFYRGKVWRPAIKAEMLRVGLLANGQPVTAGPGVYYVGGLELGERRGLKSIGHGGKDMGFMAELTRYPDQHLTVALLCNQIFRITAVSDALADLYLVDQYTQPAPAAPERGETRPPPEPGQPIPAAVLKAAPGLYYNREIDGRYAVEVAGDSLTLRVGPHQVRQGPLRWFGDDVLGFGRSRLTLKRDSEGRIFAFEYEGFEFLRQ